MVTISVIIAGLASDGGVPWCWGGTGADSEVGGGMDECGASWVW